MLFAPKGEHRKREVKIYWLSRIVILNLSQLLVDWVSEFGLESWGKSLDQRHLRASQVLQLDMADITAHDLYYTGFPGVIQHALKKYILSHGISGNLILFLCGGSPDNFILYCVCVTRNWIQGLTGARQALYLQLRVNRKLK